MTTFNPYEAPQTVISPRQGPAEGVDLWQDGKYLVARDHAVFPDRCILCDAPAEGYRFKRTVRWHPQAYYLFFLFNVLLYILVAQFVSKRTRIEAGVCPRHRRRRRNAILLGFLLVLLVGPAIMTAGSTLPDPWFVIVASIGGIVTLGGLLQGVFRSQIFRPKQIDKQKFLWLDKVNSEFVAALPGWPGERIGS